MTLKNHRENLYFGIILFLVIFTNIYYASITHREGLTMKKIKKGMMKPVNKISKGLKAMIDAIKKAIAAIKQQIMDIITFILYILILPIVIMGLMMLTTSILIPFVAFFFSSIDLSQYNQSITDFTSNLPKF